MTPIQQFLQRFLLAVDTVWFTRINNGQRPGQGQGGGNPQGAGLIGNVLTLQGIMSEGIAAGYILTLGANGVAANAPVDSDLAAIGNPMTAAKFNTMVGNLQVLNAALTPLLPALLAVRYG